ncbi:hypothetical protein, partial [Methylibium sp.]|uniref:hypothetical protein n=1 Tax=Methylibium sp. TaxID=2067992 RepID=UPI0025F4A670
MNIALDSWRFLQREAVIYGFVIPRKPPASYRQIAQPEPGYTAFQVVHGHGNQGISAERGVREGFWSYLAPFSVRTRPKAAIRL